MGKVKRSLMTHLESTKDTAQEKVIEFGSKGGKSEGDKRLMELDALIRKRQMELNNSPKKQRYNGNIFPNPNKFIIFEQAPSKK